MDKNMRSLELVVQMHNIEREKLWRYKTVKSMSFVLDMKS